MPHSEIDLALFHHDLALREIGRVTRGRVRLIIVVRYGTGTASSDDNARHRRRLPGSEIVSVWLVFRGASYKLPLSTPHLIVFDYLCWNCAGGIGQTAGEVEAGLNEQLFYVQHASSAKRLGPVLARASRTNIRKIVERIRESMAELFAQAHLPLDPWLILRSEPTSTREVRYSIWADVHWSGL